MVRCGHYVQCLAVIFSSRVIGPKLLSVQRLTSICHDLTMKVVALISLTVLAYIGKLNYIM